MGKLATGLILILLALGVMGYVFKDGITEITANSETHFTKKDNILSTGKLLVGLVEEKITTEPIYIEGLMQTPANVYIVVNGTKVKIPTETSITLNKGDSVRLQLDDYNEVISVTKVNS